jgi:HNH endonuclease/AP2 domain
MTSFVLLPVKDGLCTIVDGEDYEKVKGLTWHLSSHGYASNSKYCGGGRKNAKYKTTKMHRFILGLTSPKPHIDHINGNRLDNRKSNLRIVTQAQNTQNRGLNTNNKSGYKGVTWSKESNKWVAGLTLNKKKYHLGYFADKHDAAKAYNEKALELYGDYARLNEIMEGE